MRDLLAFPGMTQQIPVPPPSTFEKEQLYDDPTAVIKTNESLNEREGGGKAAVRHLVHNLRVHQGKKRSQTSARDPQTKSAAGPPNGYEMWHQC